MKQNILPAPFVEIFEKILRIVGHSDSAIAESVLAVEQRVLALVVQKAFANLPKDEQTRLENLIQIMDVQDQDAQKSIAKELVNAMSQEKFDQYVQEAMQEILQAYIAVVQPKASPEQRSQILQTLQETIQTQ